MSGIKIIEVCSELGAGTRGASLGPDAIRIAALDYKSRYFKKYPSTRIQDENHLLMEATGSATAKRISGVLTMWERVSEMVSKTLKEGTFPIILSGDHSVAGGTITGIRMAAPKEKLGVIWIDAHADLHSPYTTPSGNIHGMALAAMLDEDNVEFSVNKPDQETKNYWYQLKNLGGIAPKITFKDLVYIGLRDTEKPEMELLKRHGVKNFTVQEIRKKNVEKIAIEALALLDHCDKIYISFDVDVMDPAVSKGTGTPVPNGITDKECAIIISRLLESEKVGCFEITEVNPTLDKDNAMAETAFEILVRATNQLVEE